MIKFDGSIVVANTSTELDTLASLLATNYPEFLYSVDDNRDDNFPFKLVVLTNNLPDAELPPMDIFFQFLVSKIDEVNQPT